MRNMCGGVRVAASLPTHTVAIFGAIQCTICMAVLKGLTLGKNWRLVSWGGREDLAGLPMCLLAGGAPRQDISVLVGSYTLQVRTQP